MDKSTTTFIYPPSGPSATPVTPTADAERPIIPPVRRVVGIGLPVRDGGPRRRVKGLEQVDREQVLRVLDAAVAQPLVSEEDVLRAYNSRPQDTAFGRRRLRELGEVA